MKTEKLIPGIPQSDNRFKGRKNVWEYRKEKQEWKQIVCAIFKKEHHHPGPVILTLEYHFHTKRRRDPDNYSGKAIIDGLVAAGTIVDDSFAYITLQLRGKYDAAKNREYVKVVIEDE